MVGDGDLTDKERRFLECCQFQPCCPPPILWPRSSRESFCPRAGADAPSPSSRGRSGRWRCRPFAVPADRRPVDDRRLADRRGAGSRVRTSDRSSLSAAFGAGWWMGFGYFLAGLWWVGSALLVEADKFAWALPLAVVALPAALAVFPAAGFALARLLWSPGPARIFALAFGARGRRMGARPPVHRLSLERSRHGARRQSRACPDRVARRPARAHVPDDRDLRRAGDAVAGERKPAQPRRRRLSRLLRWSLMAAFGEFRLMAPASATLPGVKLRLIQPNVGQDDASFSPETKQAILRRYLRLVGARDLAGSIGGSRRHPPDLARVGVSVHSVARPAGAFRDRRLSWARRDADHRRGAAGGRGRPPRYFNSIEIVGRDGLSAQRYDKQHLVPFGEYIPFASLLERAHITQMVDIPGGFEAGSGRRILQVPGLPDAMPLICYEAIFPDRARRPRIRRRAAWLAPKCDRRRLVRSHAGPVSALRASPVAGDRTGPAAGARRQFRHLGGA